MTVDVTPAVREFLLAIADDKHLMGQQHAEWIGVTPFLEEDLAFCSIGQDELGHAALLYELLAGDDDAAIDSLAYDRGADDYRSCHLVELATDDWTVAFARHWLFDTADQHRWALVSQSTVSELQDVAARVEREERFHRLHADNMLDVLLADATARDRFVTAVAVLAPLTQGLFEPVAGEAEAVATGVAAGPLAAEWDAFVATIEARIGAVEWGSAPSQAQRTLRSDDWRPLMARMREVIDLDLSATW